MFVGLRISAYQFLSKSAKCGIISPKNLHLQKSTAMSSFVKDLSHPTKRAKNNTLQVIDKVAKNRERNEAANPQKEL